MFTNVVFRCLWHFPQNNIFEVLSQNPLVFSVFPPRAPPEPLWALAFELPETKIFPGLHGDDVIVVNGLMVI